MTLTDFALLVDAPPKWVLNTRAILGPGVRYTVPIAERLALVRVLNRDLGIALPRAWSLAGAALLRPVGQSNVVSVVAGDGLVTLEIDVHRLQAALATRRSQLATMHEPRRAGRKPSRSSNPVFAAQRHGLDVSLLQANLKRSPSERLRQLDAMASFSSRVRRKP